MQSYEQVLLLFLLLLLLSTAFGPILWPTSFLLIWTTQTVSFDVKEPGVKLNTCLHILPSFRTQGTTPPHPLIPHGLMIN